MAIPAVGAEGLRQTVNYNLSTAQTVWNVRSALNVAALNCQEPEYANVLPAYSSFLTNNKRELNAINQQVRKEFKDRYGSEGLDAQDTYMTQVYNYFALPPTQDEFCRVSSQIAAEMLLMAPSDLESFATRSLQSIEAVFEDFYRAYEQYRVNVALWDAQYGPPTPVHHASYTGPAVYTPADQGFGPEQTGQPVFMSEPVVEGQITQTVVDPVIEGQASQSVPQIAEGQTVEPTFTSQPVSEGESTAAVPQPNLDYNTGLGAVESVDSAPGPVVGNPAGDSQPVFVSNPVVEPIPEESPKASSEAS